MIITTAANIRCVLNCKPEGGLSAAPVLTLTPYHRSTRHDSGFPCAETKVHRGYPAGPRFGSSPDMALAEAVLLALVQAEHPTT